MYVSASTAGGLTQTLPSGSGNVIEYVGYAISATEIYFNPQPSSVTVATTTTTVGSASNAHSITDANCNSNASSINFTNT